MGRWMSCGVLAVLLVVAAMPATAGAGEERPGLVSFGGAAATVVESPDGGFDVTIDRLYPLASYSHRPRVVRSGARLPFDSAAPLIDREGIEALLLRPDAPDSEDAVLVELTDTQVTPDGRFTAHASTLKKADDSLLDRGAKGVDERLDEAPAPLQVTVADSEGEMSDVVPAVSRAQQVVDTDYEVTTNNIFTYTPLPKTLIYNPSNGTCVKDFVKRQTSDFTDNWITLRGFTVDSSFDCWFQPSKASYAVTIGDASFNVEIEQEAITSSNFKVNYCNASAGYFCKGSNGLKSVTLNLFKT
jgi:hypothetical protein